MTLIQKLILSEFIKILLFTFIALFSLFFIIDFVEKIDDFVENKASIQIMFSYFIYKIPFIYSQIMPITVLMATIISLSLLSKHNEITAIKSSGANLVRALAPLMAGGLIISFTIFFINEVVAPSTSRLSSEIEQNWIKKSSKNKLEGSFTKAGYWIKLKRGIIKIKSLENDNKTLRGVTIYVINDNLSGSITTSALNWNGLSWQPNKDIESNVDKNQINEVLKNISPPQEIGTSTKRGFKDMDFFELQSYIDSLEEDGHDTDKYKVELYSKLSFPLVSFIMVLIGMSFGLKSGRNSGVALGVAVAFIIGFSYWIVFGISISLGVRGVLPPIVSAFFTDILFIAIGVLMLGYVKR